MINPKISIFLGKNIDYFLKLIIGEFIKVFNVNICFAIFFTEKINFLCKRVCMGETQDETLIWSHAIRAFGTVRSISSVS